MESNWERYLMLRSGLCMCTYVIIYVYMYTHTVMEYIAKKSCSIYQILPNFINLVISFIFIY